MTDRGGAAEDEVGATTPTISAIVPTIGRPESLTRLLVSLAAQTRRVDEVVVADGSSDGRTAVVVSDARWAETGFTVRRIFPFIQRVFADSRYAGEKVANAMDYLQVTKALHGNLTPAASNELGPASFWMRKDA